MASTSCSSRIPADQPSGAGGPRSPPERPGRLLHLGVGQRALPAAERLVVPLGPVGVEGGIGGGPEAIALPEGDLDVLQDDLLVDDAHLRPGQLLDEVDPVHAGQLGGLALGDAALAEPLDGGGPAQLQGERLGRLGDDGREALGHLDGDGLHGPLTPLGRHPGTTAPPRRAARPRPGRALQEQGDGLLQVGDRLLGRVALAGDVESRAEGDVNPSSSRSRIAESVVVGMVGRSSADPRSGGRTTRRPGSILSSRAGPVSRSSRWPPARARPRRRTPPGLRGRDARGHPTPVGALPGAAAIARFPFNDKDFGKSKWVRSVGRPARLGSFVAIISTPGTPSPTGLDRASVRRSVRLRCACGAPGRTRDFPFRTRSCGRGAGFVSSGRPACLGSFRSAAGAGAARSGVGRRRTPGLRPDRIAKERRSPRAIGARGPGGDGRGTARERHPVVMKIGKRRGGRHKFRESGSGGEGSSGVRGLAAGGHWGGRCPPGPVVGRPGGQGCRNQSASDGEACPARRGRASRRTSRRRA